MAVQQSRALAPNSKPTSEPRTIAELTPNQVADQVQKIQELMRSVMKEDTHFGVIPGTNKPSLYKPGAEKIGLMFQLSAQFEFAADWDGDHVTYTATCKIVHTPSGNVVGEGIGVCSSKESRYKYRQEVVGEVPKEYWDTRNPELLQGCETGKRKGQWVLLRRVTNPDLADTWNTIAKMAKKRAHVDAIITTTAASDLFTQDLEDMPRESLEDDSSTSRPSPSRASTTTRDSSPPANKKVAKKKAARKQTGPSTSEEDEGPVESLTEGQRKKLWAIAFNTIDKEIYGEWAPKDFLSYAIRATALRDTPMEAISVKALSKDQAAAVIETLDDGVALQQLADEFISWRDQDAVAEEPEEEPYEDENVPF